MTDGKQIQDGHQLGRAVVIKRHLPSVNINTKPQVFLKLLIRHRSLQFFQKVSPIGQKNQSNLKLMVSGAMHNFLFSQSTLWLPNHESNRAQVRKETSSARIQYIPQVSKQNFNLFSRYWCDASHYMILIKQGRKGRKFKTTVCCASLLVEPTINIW
jgi:hypothetical protein